MNYQAYIRNARAITDDSRMTANRIICKVPEALRNDFRMLRLEFEIAGQSELFDETWSLYSDFCDRLRARTVWKQSYAFPTESDSVTWRWTSDGEIYIRVGFLYLKTGYDPQGLFTEDDIPLLKLEYEKAPAAADMQEVTDWLDAQYTLRHGSLEDIHDAIAKIREIEGK